MGQLGSNLGNSNITNPQQANWGDLDSSEKGARIIAQGTRGLARGFQNYQQQGQALRGRGGIPGINPLMTGNNLSFYGDSNG